MNMVTRFPSISRHWQVLRESWRDKDIEDRSRKSHAETEFLPAALEIIETPPSPVFRTLLIGLCVLFLVAVLWSFFGKLDVVAVASGKTLPVANVKLIQPLEAGTVRAIHVRNGQRVRKGQLLIELDPTIAGADEAQASVGLMSAQIARARNQALLAHLSGRPASFFAPAGVPSTLVETQRQLVASVIAEYEAERASLLQARAERRAELVAAEAELAKLEQTLPLVEQQLSARKTLTEQGHFSKLKLLEYEQIRVEHVQNIAIQRSSATKTRAAIANIDAQLAKLRQSFAKTAAGDLSTAEDDASLRTEELRKSERRKALQQLKAPVDGTVQQLAVHTIGGVVQAAQPLMVIVPDGGEIEIEAKVLNKDIGFVREGQPVRVKLEAFPFTDYGLVEGKVVSLSRDAVQEAAAPPATGLGQSAAGQQGLIYLARIRLERNYLQLGQRRQPIGPGLAVQAEIKTGERRIIQYLLSPISQTVDEAGRER